MSEDNVILKIEEFEGSQTFNFVNWSLIENFIHLLDKISHFSDTHMKIFFLNLFLQLLCRCVCRHE